MGKIYLLSDLKFDGVENLEVFKIKYLNFSVDLSKYDALVFTSKNAVLSLSHSNNSWEKVPSYAISQKTAELIEKLGGKVVFTGIKAHGNEFAYIKYSFGGFMSNREFIVNTMLTVTATILFIFLRTWDLKVITIVSWVFFTLSNMGKLISLLKINSYSKLHHSKIRNH